MKNLGANYMSISKVKITQKEFDELYEITGDTEVNPTPEPEIPEKQDTTPSVLDEQEQIQEDEYLSQMEDDIEL